MLLNSVVLPEPLGPITPTISPGPTDEADAVDGLDRAVVLPHVLDFEEAGSVVIWRLRCVLKRSASESSPPGSHTISAIDREAEDREIPVLHESAAIRARSTTITDRRAPGPKKRPEPPTITASSIISDTEKWNGPGSMNLTSAAR